MYMAMSGNPEASFQLCEVSQLGVDPENINRPISDNTKSMIMAEASFTLCEVSQLGVNPKSINCPISDNIKNIIIAEASFK